MLTDDRVPLQIDVNPLRIERTLSPNPGPANGHTIRPHKSFDDRPRTGSRRSSTTNLNAERPSTSGSRSESPRRADVPHSVESGTDTEAEGEVNSVGRSVNNSEDDLRPTPPPKDDKGGVSPGESLSPSVGDVYPDSSNVSQQDSGSDVSELSSPVERMSHATFIAPALPPIRFSMNSADFSDLLSTVGGGMPSLKSLDQLVKLSEEPEVPMTPPSTATSFGNASSSTPTGSTVFGTPLQSSTLKASSPDEDTNINDKAEAGGKVSKEADRTDQYVSTFTFDPHQVPTIQSKPHPSKTAQRPSAPNTPHPSLLESQPSETSASPTVFERSSLESQRPLAESLRSGNESTHSTTSTSVTLTEPGTTVAASLNQDSHDLVLRRVQESLADAKDRGAQQLKLERGFVEAILEAMELQKEEFLVLKGRFDGAKVRKSFISKVSF